MQSLPIIKSGMLARACQKKMTDNDEEKEETEEYTAIHVTTLVDAARDKTLRQIIAGVPYEEIEDYTPMNILYVIRE